MSRPTVSRKDLTEGILRMRYRDSQEHAELMNPGQIYEITVDLWATSNVFLRGHSLRLEISSSNFPRFDRNLNTGEEINLRATLCQRPTQFFTMLNIRRR